MAKQQKRILHLADGHTRELSEQDHQRLAALAALEGLTPKAWLLRETGASIFQDLDPPRRKPRTGL